MTYTYLIKDEYNDVIEKLVIQDSKIEEFFAWLNDNEYLSADIVFEQVDEDVKVTTF